jgi:hypothetical protein
MLATTQPIKRWWTVSSAVLQSTHFSLWGRPHLLNLSVVQILPWIKARQLAALKRTPGLPNFISGVTNNVGLEDTLQDISNTLNFQMAKLPIIY